MQDLTRLSLQQLKQLRIQLRNTIAYLQDTHDEGLEEAIAEMQQINKEIAKRSRK